ncbi:MAG: hypothetical protein HQK57_00375 [Deltaproteobacteria bacterium]|nr:hypothetical protein [Deltaproteobacteria bacterium]
MNPYDIKSVYNETFTKLNKVVDDLREKDPDLAGWCGYFFYAKETDRDQHGMVSMAYKLEGDEYYQPKELKGAANKLVSLQICDEIYMQLGISWYCAKSLGTVLGSNIFLDSDRLDSRRLAGRFDHKTVECFFCGMPYIGPPTSRERGIIMLVNPDARSIVETISSAFAGKPGLGSEILATLKDGWINAYSKSLSADVLDDYYLEFKNGSKSDSGKHPLAPTCVGVLKAFKEITNSLRKYGHPIKITICFCEAVFNTSIGLFGAKSEIHRKIKLLTNEFLYVEGLLLRTPRYRDHFFHQYMVFLIGVVVLGCLPKDAIDELVPGITNPDEIICGWFLTSVLHDIGYPLEKFPELAAQFVSHYSGSHQLGGSEPQNRQRMAGLFAMIFDGSKVFLDEESVFALDDMAVWLANGIGTSKLWGNGNTRAWYVGRLINQLTHRRDHGLLSAVIVHKVFSEFLGQAVCPAWLEEQLPQISAAIAFHSTMLTNPICKYDRNEIFQEKVCKQNVELDGADFPILLAFEKAPLAFLLLLCDALQDWGRALYDEGKPRPIPDLVAIKFDAKNKVMEFDLKYTRAPEPLSEEFNQKRAELARAFARFRSNSFKFVVKLDDTAGRKKKYISLKWDPSY